MKFRAVRATEIGAVDALIVPVFQDGAAPAGLSRSLRSLVEKIAKETGTSRLYVATGHIGGERGIPGRLVVVNAGKPAEWSVERARWVASAGVRTLWRSNSRRVGIVVVPGALGADLAVRAAVEGVHFAMWRPEAHRTGKDDRRLPPLATVVLGLQIDRSEKLPDVGGAIARGEAVGEAVNVARRLANEPANKMSPTILADEARGLAKAAGVRIEVLDRERCRALGMESFLSVAQGSHQPPRFIVLRYQGRGGRGYDIAFVGKGITFDSGGISIKQAEGMHRMKGDMTGAAAVIAALAAIGRLRLHANVLGVAPCTENLPGGAATKPGDVFTSMSGKTVEVLNTDAEGRLVLIDGVTYAQREGAKRVVDVATLTGAIQIALGHHFSGLFGRPESFVEEVRQAGAAAGDRLWPMPLTDEYRDEIRSEIADIVNSAGREGGAIKGAAFIEAVVEPGTEWAHIDIASTFWSEKDRPQSPKGPQGPAVRTLIELAERAAG